ncbi:MAG: hypothetical protein GX444_01765 [Myxococcales bacterium]|nr:hypothetical protein [Myxococcales bacterium]
MKKGFILLILTSILMATSALAADSNGGLMAGFGAINLGGTMKAGLNYYIGDETLGENTDGQRQAMDNGKDTEFVLNTLLLKVYGWVVDNRVGYFSTIAYDQATNAMSVLDLKLGFSYIPYTTFVVGRIRPEMTYYNSLPEQMWKTIDEPLMNRLVFPRTRQTGLDIAVNTPYVDANLAIYNGREYFPSFVPQNALQPVGNANWLDQNTTKDVHFGLVGKPVLEGLKVRANVWYGMPVDNFKDDQGSLRDQFAKIIFVNGGIDFLGPCGVVLVGEVLYGDYTWNKKNPGADLQFSHDRQGTDDRSLSEDYTLQTLSYYVMAGFNFGPKLNVPVEVLARYDYLDPDTLNDKTKDGHPLSDQDALTDIMGGVNYYLQGYHAMISLNYIHHGEEWENVLTKKGDSDQTGIDNDELKVQAQVAF